MAAAVLMIRRTPVLNVRQPLTDTQIQKNRISAIILLTVDFSSLLLMFHIQYGLAAMAFIAISAVYILMIAAGSRS